MIKIEEVVKTVKVASIYCDRCGEFLYHPVLRGDDHMTKETKYERHLRLENNVFTSELCDDCSKSFASEIYSTLDKYKFMMEEE